MSQLGRAGQWEKVRPGVRGKARRIQSKRSDAEVMVLTRG